MSAIQATFSDFRLVKSRSVAQLVMEVPIEAADAALETLGGLPRPGEERWAAIAPLDVTKAEPAKRPFASLPRSQQAAIKVNDAEFQLFIVASGAADADRNLKKRLGIESKRDLDTNPEAGKRWDALLMRFLEDTGRMAERR